MINKNTTHQSGSGTGEARRYAQASRSILMFVTSQELTSLKQYAIGPVRHASIYNRALRAVHPKDTDDVKALKSRIDVKGFTIVIDSDHIAHVRHRHADTETELKRGQRAIGLSD